MRKLRYSNIKNTAKEIGKHALRAAAPVAVGAALAFRTFFTPNIALAETCVSSTQPFTSQMKKKKAMWGPEGKYFYLAIGLDDKKALVVRMPSSFLERHKDLPDEKILALYEANGLHAVMLHLKNKKGEWPCIGADKRKKASPEEAARAKERMDKVRSKIAQDVKEALAAIERRKKTHDVAPVYAHLEKAIVLMQKQELSEAEAVQALKHLEGAHNALKDAKRKPGVLTQDEVEDVKIFIQQAGTHLKNAKPLLRKNPGKAKETLRKAEKEVFLALEELNGKRQIRRHIGLLAKAHGILNKESPTKRELGRAYAFIKRAARADPLKLRKIGRAKKKEQKAWARMLDMNNDIKRWDEEATKPAPKPTPTVTPKPAPKATGDKDAGTRDTLDDASRLSLRQAKLAMASAKTAMRKKPAEAKKTLRKAVGDVSQALDTASSRRQVKGAVAKLAKAHELLKKGSLTKRELKKALALVKGAVKAADPAKLKRLTSDRSQEEQDALKKMSGIKKDAKKWVQEQRPKEAAKQRLFSRKNPYKMMNAHKDMIKAIWERAYKRDPTIRGKVAFVDLEVNPEGKVTKVSFSSRLNKNSQKNEEIERRLKDRNERTYHEMLNNYRNFFMRIKFKPGKEKIDRFPLIIGG